MARILIGGLGAILLLVAGFAWLQAAREDAADPAAAPPPVAEAPPVPPSDPGDLRGPDPPEATELTREERRFLRYDRNADRIITREEMMASRSKAFRALDTDGNNLLTFEEWAVATSARFAGADANRDKRLTPEEFATTKPKRQPARCGC